MRARRRPIVAGLTAAAAATATALLVPGTPALADANNNSSAKLQKAVTTEGVLQHLRAFQAIADANDGTRAAGTPGFDASAVYVHDKLAAAGYDVRYQEFTFPFFEETAPAQFSRVSPDPAPYTDFRIMTYSGKGDVTGKIVPVDVKLPPGPTPSGNTSGCEAGDFAGFPAGSIALLQRGTCTFGAKATNAAAAGAAGVVIFNEGQPGRQETLNGTLGAPVGVPVIGTSFDLGQQLAAQRPVVRLVTSTISENRTTRNVIANSRTGKTDNVVMTGAHLDSVTEGPGINDNGSGSASILEVALQLAKTKPANQLRFAWWSGEELGLLGSTYYVNSLTPAQRKQIALYLNFDMVASPNYVLGVYDGDGSSFGLKGPEGSAQIEDQFNRFFTSRKSPFQGTEFSGRSDYQAFINNGIPAGGLFTGAEVVKTAAEQKLYGGKAGIAFDPCYHQACDDLTGADRDAAKAAEYAGLTNLIGNVNTKALDINSDAIADAVATFAFDTSAVNGKRNPGKSPGVAKGTPGRHGDTPK